MATTPRELFDHADAMSSSDEVQCRTTISRSYYAAFHAAREYHEELDTGGCLPPNLSGVHATLYHQLTNPTVADDEKKVISRKLGYMGIDLKRYRTIADYDLGVDVCSEKVKYVIQTSKRVLINAGKY